MADAGGQELRSIERDYRREFPRLRRCFLGGDPRDLTVLLPDRALGRRTYLRDETLAALRDHNEAYSCGDTTLSNIDLLDREDVQVILATHAPCFLTGPLVVVYKALTCIQLAAYCRETLGLRAVPVFWLAGDAAQSREQRTVRFVNMQDRIVALNYEPDALDAHGPSGAVPLEDQADFLLRLLGHDTANTDYKRYLTDLLLDTRARSHTVGEWTARLLHALFHIYGLVVLDESAPFATAQMVRCLAEPYAWGSRPARLVNEAAAELGAAHYGGVLSVAPNAAAFAFRTPDGLEQWTTDGSRFVSSAGATLNADVMRQHLVARRAQVHLSDWLRPIVQASWLPVLAAVAGPSETRTYAHLGKLYEVAGIPMPLVFPRVRVVLVESHIHQILEKYAVAITDFIHDRRTLTERTLAKEIPRPVIAACDRKLSVLQDVLDELRDEVEASNPEYVEEVDGLKRVLGLGLEELRRELVAARSESPAVISRNLERARAHLFPEARPQERMLNAFPFLFTHGIQLINRLTTELDIFSFDVQTVRL